MLLALLLALSVSVSAFDKPASGTTVLTLTVPAQDAAPPEVSIQIGLRRWQKFLNTVSFGWLYSGAQTVTIRASDADSGVDTLWYLARDTALTADTVKDDALVWTPIENGGSFRVEPDAKLVVYVKAKDKAGNVGYYSSDGFLVRKCCRTSAGVLLYAERTKLPEGASALLCAYDENGQFVSCRWGSAVQDGWLFDGAVAAHGKVWKCFLYDKDYKPVQAAVEIFEISETAQ